ARSTTTSSARSRGIRGWWLAEERSVASAVSIHRRRIFSSVVTSLNQLERLQARVAVLADDEVVVHRGDSFLAFCLGSIFQNIAGLAVERGANPFERLEADAFDLARLQQRHVLLADADLLGQLLRARLTARQHDIEGDDDGHAVT